MAKLNSWKIGIGSGSMIFGIYVIFQYQQNILFVILGIIALSLGLGLIASDLR